MDETYITKVIILKCFSFRENDSKIIVYSRDRGKLELVARGTKKISSKLAGHIEPISLSDIMVVRGKQYDYIGSAVSNSCYRAIKSDLDKLQIAGKAIRIFNKLVRPEQKDEDIYILLQDFFNEINKKDLSVDYELLYNFFILKLLVILGYGPELYYCAECRQKVKPEGNKFDFMKGGLICNNCKTDGNSLTISENCIKVMRFTINKKFTNISKLKIENSINNEIKKIISSFLEFRL